ncbi:hypothetical protein AWZ03_013719 [Drosophila navojoa]|uniref:Uncharacterized protein n=1 Tax=Drosophila navojoa TaxID=7232 RepID=A0A484AVH3_DRONA|nr:hypothetical protein AWZ03_013719 [Drosophila navojoa]
MQQHKAIKPSGAQSEQQEPEKEKEKEQRQERVSNESELLKTVPDKGRNAIKAAKVQKQCKFSMSFCPTPTAQCSLKTDR